MKSNVSISMKSLAGYFGFLRILIMFVKRYPELKEKIDKIVSDFIENERYQVKTIVCIKYLKNSEIFKNSEKLTVN